MVRRCAEKDVPVLVFGAVEYDVFDCEEEEEEEQVVALIAAERRQ